MLEYTYLRLKIRRKEMHKEKIQKTISQVAGVNCELIIRGVQKFTIAFLGENTKAVESLQKYFSGQVKEWESDYDLECDQTCIWFSV
jgi:hypothetical protein